MNVKTLGLCPKPEDLGTLSQALLRGLLKEKSPKNLQDLELRGFLPLFFCGADFSVAVFRATISGCFEPHSASGMSTTAVSLRYRIEMVQVS